MKLSSLKTFLVATATAIGFGACTNGSSELKIDQNLAQCLTYSKDINTQAQGLNRISFSTQFNYSNNTVDLAITGLEIPVAGSSTGLQFPKMEFQGLPWKYNNMGWKVIDLENVKPSIVGMNDAPVFTEFNFKLIDVFNGDLYTPGIMYDFEVEIGTDDNKTEANVVGCCMTGKTVSTSPDGLAYTPEEDDAVKDKNKPAYWLDFDFEASKVDIHIYNAKFLGAMPSLNMVFPDVPFTVENGIIALNCASLIPEYNGIPNKGFPISQLTGTVNFTEGMTLDFHCNFRGADYSVEFKGKY